FNEEALATVLRPLRDLQDVLGEFQDTEVQGKALLELADELATTDDHSGLLAIGGVVEQLAMRGSTARNEFSKVFGRFDDRKVQRAMNRIEVTKSSGKKKR
ncbi:MAG: CHAD domain-containing protein, partial [Acidimicrobiia bacterium]|nr:CHAD domain-containing protein [Acidimicrobiia bacterium]